MENKNLVTAIITTHNRPELCKEAIRSVFDQTYKNIECIVVDDASNEKSSNSLQKYISDYYPDTQYIYISSKESKGGNHARNIGVNMSKGAFIAFLDDDDEWLPTKIEEQIALIESNPSIGFVYCGRIYETNFDKDSRLEEDIQNNKYRDGNLKKEILIHILTVTSTILVKKELITEAGLFDEELHSWQEYDLCIRILQQTQCGLVRKNLVLYRIISTDKNRVSNKVKVWEQDVKYINKKYENLINSLTLSEKNKRRAYIYIDGINRARNAKRTVYIIKYVLLMIFDIGAGFEIIKKLINTHL